MRHSSSIFKQNHIVIEEENNPSDKVVMVDERLDDIDIAGIGNLVDSPRLVFIDECGNLNPIQDGLFRGCSRMGGPFWPPSLKSATHILQ